MYKKHGIDQETLELQLKALVAKALEEQGLSTEPQTLMMPLEELALVGSPPKIPSSQGSKQPQPPSIAYENQLVAPWCFSANDRTL